MSPKLNNTQYFSCIYNSQYNTYKYNFDVRETLLGSLGTPPPLLSARHQNTEDVVEHQRYRGKQTQ